MILKFLLNEGAKILSLFLRLPRSFYFVLFSQEWHKEQKVKASNERKQQFVWISNLSDPYQIYFPILHFLY